MDFTFCEMFKILLLILNDAYCLCSAVAETTTGCLFATEEQDKYADIDESDVTKATMQLLNTVQGSSACVDEYLQDQVSIIGNVRDHTPTKV